NHQSNSAGVIDSPYVSSSSARNSSRPAGPTFTPAHGAGEAGASAPFPLRRRPSRRLRSSLPSLGRGAEGGVEDAPRARARDRVLDRDQVAGAGEHELE